MSFSYERNAVVNIVFKSSVPTGSSITPDALVIKSVTVELKQIPNQPITFMVNVEYFEDWNICFCVYRLIHRKKFDMKMQSLHGHGEHSLNRMVVIHIFYFECP